MELTADAAHAAPSDAIVADAIRLVEQMTASERRHFVDRLPVGIADDEAGVRFLSDPGRRESGAWRALIHLARAFSSAASAYSSVSPRAQRRRSESATKRSTTSAVALMFSCTLRPVRR